MYYVAECLSTGRLTINNKNPVTSIIAINTDKKILLMTNKNISSKDNIYIIKDSLINLDTESLIKSHYAEIKGLLEG